MDYSICTYILLAISVVALVFLVAISFYYLIFWTISGKKCVPVPHSDKKTKFAVLIAARNESKVIRGIFTSLKEQTYDPKFFDVWAIVEDENDPTVEIAKEYGYKTFVRDQLREGRRTKGFALQECIEYFKRENIIYDSYMIFDADNVMDSNYIEVMNDLRQTGVKVGLGTRCYTNASKNWLTACSAIMFTYMNQITSRGRTKLFSKATIMGTGYFVDKEIIDDAGGWIFTGMTEDIQLTSYCYYRDIYMRFYPLVRFYDEQSPVYHDVHMQHLRWLAGYFSKRKFLKKEGVQYDYHTKGMQHFMRFEFKVGLFPFLAYIVLCFLLLIACLVFGTFASYAGSKFAPWIFALSGYQLFMMWVMFVIPSSITVYRHNDELKFTTKMKITAVCTYFFFFCDFALAFIDGLLHPKKKGNWTAIDHSGEILDKDAKKVS
ncbi:MAG: glycosyltransferase family 2 protein [Bacilli bacterium]|nr:glycosyltransferase family 2 protein [Bacilli bacterium]